MLQREMVELAQSGDRDAFATLAGGVVHRLYATAVLILRDHALAEDAVQETIVRAWRGLPSLRDPERFDAWLRRLLMNVCRDESRRQRARVAEIPLLPFHEPAIGDPSEALVDHEALERAFRRLSDEHRTVVVLHYYDGLSQREVADATGLPLGTVKSRLFHATRALRAALEADARSEDVPKGGAA